MVLVAVGRSPNGKQDRADKAGVTVTDRGFIPVDKPDAHQRAAHLRHRRPGGPADAGAQGRARSARRRRSGARREGVLRRRRSFRRWPTPIRKWRGSASPKTKPRRRASSYEKGHFPWAASGRAVANGRDEGFTKLLFDAETHRIVGGGIVGTHAGDMIGEIALAIEMGADGNDIGKTIHPHPTLGESIGMAAEVYEGVCTDLPPVRKPARRAAGRPCRRTSHRWCAPPRGRRGRSIPGWSWCSRS
jgi:dihydrolipoamide dehydrogenase